MEKQLIVKNLIELPNAATTILKDIGEHKVVAFFGKMGVGKTTLIKVLCQQMGVEDVVSSPTFALVNEYLSSDGESVFHFDFYRIESIEEVFDIGYEEYIYSGHYCFIEWPEMIVELLPETFVYLSIEENDNGTRVINYKVPD
ncbi:MAG: tRNA (adenosine(37)-N6)-threonylcarbamoyltransferase complex ATPase subunit type 1 TsaE [Bacteroidetes bacterium]|nr:MAG: tRNA (adenosine(37)-N6)-threonylcarbamoyltransferase complex ATPase subunit type 1 TsaE [Bacteroidota bacterium]